MILISSRPVGMELARELFAIVQITSVRRVINDISTDDLKIWIRTTNRLTPEPRLSLLTREARERGSSSETERTSWFQNLLVHRDPEATKARKIFRIEFRLEVDELSRYTVDAMNI